MISNAAEYERAQEEVRTLDERLRRLQEGNPIGHKGLTKAGIRKMISGLHEELALYEARQETYRPTSDQE